MRSAGSREPSREPSVRFTGTEPLEEVPQLEEDKVMGILEEIGGEFCRVTLNLGNSGGVSFG